MSSLSILCVTRCEIEVIDILFKLRKTASDLGAEFVLVVDGDYLESDFISGTLDIKVSGVVRSQGYIESVLDEAVSYTSGDYILRIDDDESIPLNLFGWLAAQQYQSFDNWKFSRAHLWPDHNHYITSSPLWPDHQTRLSIKPKSGNRPIIHSGSPYGGGELSPYPILHHKFLVKSLPQRRSIVERYNLIQPKAGDNFLAFSCPEDYYSINGGMDISPFR